MEKTPDAWPAACAEPLVCLGEHSCQYARECPYAGRLSAEVQAFVRTRLQAELSDAERPEKSRT
jgi:hypothetical protein